MNSPASADDTSKRTAEVASATNDDTIDDTSSMSSVSSGALTVNMGISDEMFVNAEDIFSYTLSM